MTINNDSKKLLFGKIERRMKPKNWEELEKNYQQFVMEMSDVLIVHKQFIKSLNQPDLLPLDYSVESLDRVEKSLDLVLDGKVELDDKQTVSTFVNRVARYTGEVLRKQAQGKWVWEENPKIATFGTPGIGQIEGMHKDYVWIPLTLVENYRARRQSGLLRKAVESQIQTYKKRKGYLDLVANIDTEVEAYKSYIESLDQSELLPLDYSNASLDRAEKSFQLIWEDKIILPDNWSKDDFETWVVAYIGEVLRKQIGGSWIYNDDPDKPCFALPGITKIKGYSPDLIWCPFVVINNYKSRQKKGTIRKAVENVIKKSKEGNR